jgi:phosphomethylpyrimidine synthase
MKITQDVRDYAESHGVDTDTALKEKLDQKSREFLEKGAELYLKA